MDFIKKWLVSFRAPFLTASIVPVIFGTALAWQMTGQFNYVLAVVAIVGVCFAQAGTNLANDYYDHKSTNDDINETPTPFSGGSRMIQEKIQSPKEVFIGSLVLFGLAAVCGLYLWLATKGMYDRPYTIPVLALIGFLSGFLYTAAPVKYGYHGLGELFIGLNFGTFSVLGAYFVQTGQLGWTPLLTSIPIGLLIAAVVYINQYPDYQADKAVNKKHWVVILGKKKAIPGYLFLVFGSYLAVILLVIFNYMPLWGLVVFVTLPLALGAAKTLFKHYDKIEQLIPANAATIKIHLSFGFLMTIALIADKLI